MMNLNRLIIFIFIAFSSLTSLSAQINDSKKLLTIEEEIEGIKQKINSEEREAAFYQIDELLKHSITSKNQKAELSLIELKCYYYSFKLDLQNLIKESSHLEEKSIAYNNIASLTISKNYLGDAYWKLGLFDQAISELESGLDLSEGINDDATIGARRNLHIVLSNIYNDKKDYKEAVRHSKLAHDDISKISNPELRKQYLNTSYSNLAYFYLNTNLDSAYYFAQKSINLLLESGKNYNKGLASNNYGILGIVAKEKKDYQKAIENFKKSEGLAMLLNDNVKLLTTYQQLIEIYQILNDEESENIYKEKQRVLQFDYSENQNETLRSIVKDKQNNEKKITSQYYFRLLLLLAASMIVVAGILFFYFKNRKQSKEKLETLSQEYHSRNLKIQSNSIPDLVELVKNNDPSFPVAFQNVFPDFYKKLKEINPSLMKSEIEFCALLKLNLSSKEIAQYAFTHYRTVQNKKYRIRKKLSIPKDADIYNWFDEV